MVSGYKRYDGVFLDRTRISDSTFIGGNEKFTIGNHVFIGHYNFIDASNGLIINDGCQITNFVSILTHSSHHAIRLYGYEYVNTPDPLAYNKAPVKIGAFTFVGPHTTIMPGTEIGKGSLVSAYSYVDGKFPDFSVISGNPAKVTGSTKDIDKKYFDEYPELKNFYHAWAK